MTRANITRILDLGEIRQVDLSRQRRPYPTPHRHVAAKSAARPSQDQPESTGALPKKGLSEALIAAALTHPDKRIRLFFQDEARVGQKGPTCHRWWVKGQRPPGLCDQRFDWTYIFAAVEPATGAEFALVLPTVSIVTMSLFLTEFAETLAPDDHAVIVLDGAG